MTAPCGSFTVPSIPAVTSCANALEENDEPDCLATRWRHMSEITELLAQLSDDNPRATGELTARVYDEIHRLAAAYMGRERADHTLQTTALVHEAYLRLIGQRHRLE